MASSIADLLADIRAALRGSTSSNNTARFELVQVSGGGFSFVPVGRDVSGLDPSTNNGFSIIRGNGADDTLVGTAGINFILGGRGNDTASYDYLNYDYLNPGSVGVYADLARRVAFAGIGDTDVLSSIENLTGSKHDDDLLGNSGGNIITAGGGRDFVDGRDGQDILVLQGSPEQWFLARSQPGDGAVTLENASSGDQVTFKNIETIRFTEPSEDGGQTEFSVAGDSSVAGGSVIARDDGNDGKNETASDNDNRVINVNEDGASDRVDVTANDTVLGAPDQPLVTGVRTGDGNFAGAATNAFGTLTLNGDGTVTFSANGAAANALAFNETQVVTFDYQVRGGDIAQVSFTIQGANDGPVINLTDTSSVTSGPVTEDGGADGVTTTILTTSGSFSYTDADTTDRHVATVVNKTTTAPGASEPIGTLVPILEDDDITTGSIGSSGRVGWVYHADSTNSAIQALRADQTIIETFTVQVAEVRDTATAPVAFATQTITVTIQGTNDRATITAVDGADLAVKEEADLTASGILIVTDTDNGEEALQPISGTAGAALYGTFTVDADGTWSYALDNKSGAVQALPEGATLTDSITVTSVDGTATHTIRVTITGTNDVPTITVADGADRAVTEDLGTDNKASGQLLITDTDTGQSSFQVPATTALTGDFGDFTFDAETGEWTFTLRNDNPAVDALAEGDTATQTLTVTSLDGTATHTISVTITGTNDTPIISETPPVGPQLRALLGGDSDGPTFSGAVIEDDGNLEGMVVSASGTFDVSDVDTGDLLTAAIAAGERGSALTLEANGFSLGDLGEDALAGLRDSLSGYLTLSDNVDVESGATIPWESGATIPWTFELPAGVVDFLPEDATLTVTYPITVTDNSDADNAVATSSITIIITGTNDIPRIVAVDLASNAATFSEDATTNTPAATGSFTVSDIDAGATLDVSASLLSAVASSGASLTPEQIGTLSNLGNFTVQPGNPANGGTVTWSYNLDNVAAQALDTDETLTLTYTVTVTDERGASSEQNVTLTITGNNDAPVVVAQSGGVTENQSRTFYVLDGASDVDGESFTAEFGQPNVQLVGSSSSFVTPSPEALSAAFTTNANGEVTFNPGTLFDSLAAGQQATVTLPFNAFDGDDRSASSNLTITITGTNDGPRNIVISGVRDFVTNGSFEAPGVQNPNAFLNTGEVPGWTILNAGNNAAGDRFEVVRENFGGFATPFGQQWLDSEESPSNSGDGFLQTINGLTDGQSYTFVFALRGQPGDLLSRITASWNNQQVPTGSVQFPDASLGVAVADGWRLYSFTVVGGAERDDSTPAGVNTLQFNVSSQGGNGNVGVAIDNVQLLDVSPNQPLEVIENQVGLGQIIANVHGEDVDGGTVSYRFAEGGDGGGRFIIDASTGNIRVRDGATFNFETQADQDGNAANGTQIRLNVVLNDGQNQDGSTTTVPVYITVVDVNEKPVLVAAEAGGTLTDTAILNAFDNLTGQIDSANVTDPDVDGANDNDATSNFENLTFALQGSGETDFGTFTVTETGAYTFTPNPTAINALDDSEDRTLTFTVRATDGGRLFVDVPVNISIVGGNDTPIVGSVAVDGLVEDGNSTLGQFVGARGNLLGEGHAADVDVEPLRISSIVAGTEAGAAGADAISSEVEVEGTYGTLTIQSNGVYFYRLYSADSPRHGALDSLGQGASASDIFTFTVTDGTVSSAPAQLTFEVTGTNDEPIITSTVGAAQTIVEDATTGSNGPIGPLTGSIAFADVDNADVHSATVTGLAVSIDLDGAGGAAPIVLNSTNSGQSLGSVLSGLPANLAALPIGGILAALNSAFLLTETSHGVTGGYDWTFNRAELTQGALDFLPKGALAKISYDVLIDDGQPAPSGSPNGASTQIVLTFQGSNDGVTFVAAGSDLTETYREIDAKTGQTDAVSLSGSIAFADADLGDVHTPTLAGSPSFSWTGTGAGTDLPDSIPGGFSLGSVTNPNGSANGSVGWTYSGANDADFDFLGVGQTLTISQDVVIADSNGSSFTKTIAVTITGTNDAPTINDASGTFEEAPISLVASDTDGDGFANFAPINLLDALGAADVDTGDRAGLHIVDADGNARNGFSGIDGTLNLTLGAEAGGDIATGETTSLEIDINTLISVGAITVDANGNLGIHEGFAEVLGAILGTGDTLNLTADVTIEDQHLARATSHIDFTILGNDTNSFS